MPRGLPPTAMVRTSREDQWNVLELSSFQLETIETFRANVAVAMNVTQNHLDRHHTFENYAEAKRRILETQSADDLALLNGLDSVTALHWARREHRVAAVLSFDYDVQSSPVQGRFQKLVAKDMKSIGLETDSVRQAPFNI